MLFAKGHTLNKKFVCQTNDYVELCRVKIVKLTTMSNNVKKTKKKAQVQKNKKEPFGSFLGYS